MPLQRQNLEALDEWQFLWKNLVALKDGYMEFAITAPTFEQKEYCRGARDAIEQVMQIATKLDAEDAAPRRKPLIKEIPVGPAR